MANYFDRQRFLSILKDPAIVETLYKMYLGLGGSETVSATLPQVVNRVTVLEGTDYSSDIAAINVEVSALSDAFAEFLEEYDASDQASSGDHIEMSQVITWSMI